MSGRQRLIILTVLVFVLLGVTRSFAQEGASLEVKGYVSGLAASGDRKLDNSRDLGGANAGLQAWIRMPDDLSLYADTRYFYGIEDPDSRLREAYLSWSAGDLTIRAGKQIIVWGRADRFNPTDVITPRNYQVLAYDDDDQRFGAVGVHTAYHLGGAYSVSALVLPAFKSSIIPAGMLPAGMLRSIEHEAYFGSNTQWGVKFDRSGDRLEWSVSFFDGFSSLPEIVLSDTGGLALETRRLRMIGADGTASPGSWTIRGEAARIDLEERTDLPFLYPHSSFYSVLGAEHALIDTATLNVQWLHREVRDYADPRAVPMPLRELAMGNALIYNQLDRIQDGISVSIRDRWLHDTLAVELAGVYFLDRHDYLAKPQMKYALDDHWSILLLADIYRGPEDSFFGGLRKNSLAYAELRYQFGPLVR
jgi:hypothetical protein